MDRETGRVFGAEEKARIQKELGVSFAEATKKGGPLMAIDKRPADDCKACAGKGFLGYYDNAKVIPCLCIFEDPSSWGAACEEQRLSPGSTTDKISAKLRGR